MSMKPSLYEQLYGKRRWIYLGLLITLIAAGVGLWMQLGRVGSPSSSQPGSLATAGKSSREVSLTASTPRPMPQPSAEEAPPLARTPRGAVVPASMDDPMVRVHRGNCLWRIAESRCGTGFRWPEIYQVNRPPIVDPNLIYSGQTLHIPCGK
jgi:nucleoid-associated protein YgaU